MLYSAAGDIGFAHYPKTAGHSVMRWFCEAFPDAALVEKHPVHEVNHLPVRESLERLRLVPVRQRGRGGWAGGLGRVRAGLGRSLLQHLPAALSRPAPVMKPCSTRIIGVVREPFEMLVSLYEYWRGYDFREPPTQPLIQAARSNGFRRFLEMAVADKIVLNYHDFFDMSGPAASNTRLLDFNTLQASLAHVCREFGVEPRNVKLGFLNAGPNRQRDHGRYQEEAGPLLRQVRSHFQWYYDVGARAMVTCPATASR